MAVLFKGSTIKTKIEYPRTNTEHPIMKQHAKRG